MTVSEQCEKKLLAVKQEEKAGEFELLESRFRCLG